MRARENGFSLIETTVVLAIVSVIMILTYQMIDETIRSAMFGESHDDLAVMTQAAVNSVHTEVVQTRMVFQDDVAGRAYRSALAVGTAHPAWTTSLLPVIDESTTVIAPDSAGTRFAGNSLLLARQLPPLTVTYDHDSDVTTPEVEFVADRYRFEYFYLSPSRARSFERAGLTLDLRLAASADYADYFQLSTAPQGTGAIVTKLMAAGLRRAWDPGRPVDAAFYELSAATDGTFGPAIASPEIAVATNRTLLRGLMGGRISGAMDYSVAFGSYRLPQQQAVFARSDSSRPGFPGGFEVKIVGPAGNRQVLTRVLLMAHIRGRFESQQGFVTTAARF